MKNENHHSFQNVKRIYNVNNYYIQILLAIPRARLRWRELGELPSAPAMTREPAIVQPGQLGERIWQSR
jgi:hypothetical protein